MSADAELVSAFVLLLQSGDAAPTERVRAAEVVYAALMELRPRALRPAARDDERVEAANLAMVRLLGGAKRPPEAGEGWTPSRVRGYLRRALLNNVLDLRRRHPVAPAAEPLEEVPDAQGPRPDAALDAAERAQASRDFVAWLLDEFVPRHGGRAAATRRRCLEEMLAVALGETTFEAIGRAACDGGPTDDAALARAAERVYKAHQRTLYWLHDEVRAQRALDGGDVRLDAIERLARQLARRPRP